MPLFDYRCPSCWTTHEVLVPSSTVTHVVCLTCGRLAEKQPAAANFTLKGSGFHRNDYRNETPKP